MKETQPKSVIEQANEAINQADPRPILTSHNGKLGKPPKTFTEEEIDAEMEWQIYTSSVGKKGLGA